MSYIVNSKNDYIFFSYLLCFTTVTQLCLSRIVEGPQEDIGATRFIPTAKRAQVRWVFKYFV